MLLGFGFPGGGVHLAVAAEGIRHRPNQSVPEAAGKPYKENLAPAGLLISTAVFNGKFGFADPTKSPQNHWLAAVFQQIINLPAFIGAAHKLVLPQGGQVQPQLVFGGPQQVQHCFHAGKVLAVQQLLGALVALGRVVVQQALQELIDHSKRFRRALNGLQDTAAVGGQVKGLFVAAGIDLPGEHPVEQPAGRIEIRRRAEPQGAALQVPQLGCSIAAGGVHHAVPHRSGEAVRFQRAGGAKIQQAAMAQLPVGQIDIQKKQVAALNVPMEVSRPVNRPDGLDYFLEDAERRIGRREPSGAQRIASAAGGGFLFAVGQDFIQEQAPAVLLFHNEKQGYLRVKISCCSPVTDAAGGDLLHRRQIKDPHCVAGAVAHLLADLFFPLEISPGLFQQDHSVLRAAARRLHSPVLSGPGDPWGGVARGRKTFFQNIPDGTALFLGRVDDTAAADAHLAGEDGVNFSAGGDNAIPGLENLIFAFICSINIHGSVHPPII